MAPFAAVVAGRLPHAPFGALIGGMVILTNGRTVLLALGAPGGLIPWFVAVIAIAAVTLSWRAWQRERRVGVEASVFEAADDYTEPREA